MSYLPNKCEADDIQEAIESTGGRCSVTRNQFGWRVGLTYHPNIDKFLRAARELGIRGPIGYSAGSGWEFPLS